MRVVLVPTLGGIERRQLGCLVRGEMAMADSVYVAASTDDQGTQEIIPSQSQASLQDVQLCLPGTSVQLTTHTTLLGSDT